MGEIATIEELQKQLDAKAQKLEDINILVMDISSTCTGYSILSLNFVTKKAKLKKAGAIWLNGDWEHAEKYSYMFNAINNYFWITEQIDYAVMERYSINPKKMTGVMVVVEMVGTIKTALHENGVAYSDILPQTWRKILGLKPIIGADKKKDFKTPAKDLVSTIVKVPEEITSNITRQERGTPSDLYDAICIGWAFSKRLGFNDLDCSETQFQTHVGNV